jgi:hypothetical protein
LQSQYSEVQKSRAFFVKKEMKNRNEKRLKSNAKTIEKSGEAGHISRCLMFVLVLRGHSAAERAKGERGNGSGQNGRALRFRQMWITRNGLHAFFIFILFIAFTRL